MFRNDSIKGVTHCQRRNVSLRCLQRDTLSGANILQFVLSVRGRHGVCQVEQALGMNGLPPRPVTWTIRRFWTSGVIQHRGNWMQGHKRGPVHVLPVRLNKPARMMALKFLIEALETYCINYGNGDGAWYVSKVLVDPGIATGQGSRKAISRQWTMSRSLCRLWSGLMIRARNFRRWISRIPTLPARSPWTETKLRQLKRFDFSSFFRALTHRISRHCKAMKAARLLRFRLISLFFPMARIWS